MCLDMLSSNNYLQTLEVNELLFQTENTRNLKSKNFSRFVQSHFSFFTRLYFETQFADGIDEANIDKILDEVILEAQLSTGIEINNNHRGLSKGSAFRLMLKILEIHDQRKGESN